MLRCTPPLGCDISKFEFRNIVRECRASQPPLGCDISKFEFRNIVRAVGRRAYRARVQHVARRQPSCPRWHCHGRRAACGAHAARPTAVPCRPARSKGHPSCFPALPRRPAGRRPDSGRPAPYRSASPLDPFRGSAAKDGRRRTVPGNPRLCARRDACALSRARAPCQSRRGRFATAGCRARVVARRCAARRAGRQGAQDSGMIRAKSRRE